MSPTPNPNSNKPNGRNTPPERFQPKVLMIWLLIESLTTFISE